MQIQPAIHLMRAGCGLRHLSLSTDETYPQRLSLSRFHTWLWEWGVLTGRQSTGIGFNRKQVTEQGTGQVARHGMGRVILQIAAAPNTLWRMVRMLRSSPISRLT